MSVQTLLEQVEKQLPSSGKIVVVRLIHDDFSRMTDDEKEAVLAGARAEAGPDGQVIKVEYVDDWRHESSIGLF